MAKRSVEQDMRKCRRVMLSAPVVFESIEKDLVDFHGEGITKDLALDCSFIWSEKLPPLHALISCEIFLPNVRQGSSAIRLRMQGRVERVAQASDSQPHCGFVIRSTQTVLVNERGEIVSDDSKDCESLAHQAAEQQTPEKCC